MIHFFWLFELSLSNERRKHREDSPICEHLHQQQAGQPLPDTLRRRAIGVRSPLSPGLFAAFLQDHIKG